MPSCRFRETQADGFHGWCEHPDAQPCTPCFLNTEDYCTLREPTWTSIKVSHDTLLKLEEAMPVIVKIAAAHGQPVRSKDAAINVLLDLL